MGFYLYTGNKLEKLAELFREQVYARQADETAWRFYEKLGYETCGAFFPPEQKVEEWIYRKRL